MSGIYRIDIIGDKRNYTYFGKTSVKFKSRWKEHKRQLRKNQHNTKFQNIWNKYKNLNFSIVEETDCPERQAYLEHYLIKSVWELDICLNLVLPGVDDIAGNRSEEAKQKQSEIMSGRTYSKAHRKAISEGKKGISRDEFTEEHRNNLSKSLKETYKNKFWPKRPCSFLGKDYEDIKDAAKEWNVSVERMKRWLEGKGKLPFKYKGTYYKSVREACEATGDKKRDVQNSVSERCNNYYTSKYERKMSTFTINGKQFSFIKEAAEYYNVSYQSIKDWIKIFENNDADIRTLKS